MTDKFKNFEAFLQSIDSDLKKIFEYQQEYICCKNGCSFCCEQGDYPLSKLEFEYLMEEFAKLDNKIKIQIYQNIIEIKQADEESYKCPFLINHSCSVYSHRPFVCRTFGVLTEDSKGNPAFPSCATKGLNFSQIYDEEKQHLSVELVEKNHFKIFPKIFRLNNKVIMNLPFAKELNIDFGEAKRLIDFL
ncbi:YkgJ family cysteine cluster protein [bacterium]|nr:YkgJ family cysteine cluster protein [bacterium]